MPPAISTALRNRAVFTPAKATCGTVFELSPREGGGWTETCCIASAMARTGQSSRRPDLRCRRQSLRHHLSGRHSRPDGTVFELSPTRGRRLDGDGAAQLRQRHRRDSPNAGLIFDAAGNLYGTTIAAAFTTSGRCSSCRPRRAGAGRRRCCIASATARTGSIPRPA